MHTTGKFFVTICLISDIFFSICGLSSEEGQRTRLLSGGDIQQKGKVHIFGLAGKSPTQFPPIVGHPDLPIWKTLVRVPGPFTVMILKGVSEDIFFQSNKFTACKVKDGKEVTNILMVFNLLKIIHPFQGI